MAAEAERLTAGRTWRVLLALTALLVPGLAAAMETLQVPVQTFDRVFFSGAGTVRLSQDGPPRLRVSGDRRALESLEVEVRDGVLRIATPASAIDLVVDLRVGSLREFVSEGNGRITGDDLRFEALRLDGAGTGSFRMQRLEARELEVHGRGTTRFDLTGQVGEQVVDLSGSGAYRAGELVSGIVMVNVAGASDVRLWAEDLLKVQVAGSADIRYTGSPRVEQRISGVANVLRVPQIVI